MLGLPITGRVAVSEFDQKALLGSLSGVEAEQVSTGKELKAHAEKVGWLEVEVEKLKKEKS